MIQYWKKAAAKIRSVLNYLKARWELKRDWDLVVIILVFAITGWSAKEMRDPVFYLFGVTGVTPFWKRALLWVFTIFPMYYLFILAYGWIFGQFSFFYNKIFMRSLGRLTKIFRKQNVKK